MTTWFTSDTHYGHANIIRHCARPFTDVHQMDAELIQRWRDCVRPDDEVYHLGDFAWKGNQEHIREIHAQLPGRKFLVRGNHDKVKAWWSSPNHPLGQALGWEWVKDYHELNLDGIKVVLCHYPFHSWNRKNHGSIHLHGHSHGTLQSPGIHRLDVGVDCMDFAPVAWEDVKTVMTAGRAP